VPDTDWSDALESESSTLVIEIRSGNDKALTVVVPLSVLVLLSPPPPPQEIKNPVAIIMAINSIAGRHWF
jgi:hypothetical protein